MAYYLHPDDWLWLIRNAGSLYAGVYNKFLPQNIISKLKRNYVLNTPSVNLNCCCTPGPIAIACQMSSPNPILAFSINPDSVQCSRICRGWEQSSSSRLVYLRVAHSANKAAFVKHMIFHCHMFKNVHRSATFWLVSPVCLNYRAVGGTGILMATLQNKQHYLMKQKVCT